MQCPRCGATNSENRAACWKCFAQLSPAPGGKPQEISFKTSAPAPPAAPVEPSAAVVQPVQAAPPIAEPAPVVEIAPAAQPAPVEIAPAAPPAQAGEDMFSFLNAQPEEEPEPQAARPSNTLDLDEPSGGVDITRFIVPELAEKDEKPEEGPESKH